MRTSTSRISRVLALTLGGALSLGLLTTTATATAATDDLDAPYARAAAKVAANATVEHSKNVTSVTRGGSSGRKGIYCVKVPTTAVSNLGAAAILATLSDYRGEITAIGKAHAYCGNDAHTITVVTSDDAGKDADRPFTVAVL
ncbi:hypothetical protein AB0C52_20085 [Streptomyces sp. NPDC048717]|uniref:hypothetical protein n=1 Tax=Streptomyces sp. NPDC048717 TaxID=3154928 RepID=UPI00343AA1F7